MRAAGWCRGADSFIKKEEVCGRMVKASGRESPVPPGNPCPWVVLTANSQLQYVIEKKGHTL